MAWSVWSLLIFRFLAGIGIGGEYPVNSSYIAELIPKKNRKRMQVVINGLAARLPNDSYFASANQTRLGYINLKDSKNYLGSKDLISFAIQNKFYNPKSDGAFNFRKAYSRITENDITYNYLRLWTIQHILNPEFKNDFKKGNFPVFMKPAHKISLEEVKSILRNHYSGTANDPYTLQNPNEKYRTIAVFRTEHSHILQLRSNMPSDIGNIEYIAFGMPTLSIYLPFYQGISNLPKSFSTGTDHASDDSAFWKFRKLQTLTMLNFPKYAPIVKEAIHKYETKLAKEQKDLEARYLSIYKKNPKAAKKMIEDFTNKTIESAFKLINQLTNRLFTEETHTIDMLYHFPGA